MTSESTDESERSEPMGYSAQGRPLHQTNRYVEMNKATTDLEDDNNDMAMAKPKEKYYQTMIKLQKYGPLSKAEVAFVGAGLGGRFTNTQELQAIASKHKPKWDKAVKKEHKNMTQYNVWKVRMISKLPKHVKILKSTWAMKKKASGKYQAQLTARGYEQQERVHYDSSLIASPVVNDIMIESFSLF